MKKRKLKKLLKKETQKLGIANNTVFKQMAENRALTVIGELAERTIQTAEKELYRKQVITGYLEIKLLEAIQNE